MIFLALGSNLGNTEQNILRAYELIENEVGPIIRKSSLYHTEPWGFESPNMFCNSVIAVNTTLTPRELLRATQKIERSMGRKQKSHKGSYQDRIIDIDILMYDNMVIDEPDLHIPHPLMHQRDFVLKPLKEIYDD